MSSREIVIVRPGPQGPSGVQVVTSVHGRQGAVAAQPTDYTVLTDLRVTNQLTVPCAQDGSIHQITVVLLGNDAEGNAIYQLGIQKLT